jgi:hypothetical protein
MDMIMIDDIAHALSQQCRFGGHLPEYYSVAQHSVIISYIVPDHLKMAALLHDAAEAYVLDIPRPIKVNLPGYKEMEERILKLIFQKFDLDYALMQEIKAFDDSMLDMEWSVLFLKTINIEHMTGWSSGYAKERFLEVFQELRN